MSDVSQVPLHLAVHVSGSAAAVAIAGFAIFRRKQLPVSWLGMLVAGLLIGASHVAQGGLYASGMAWPLYVRAGGFASLAYAAAGPRAGGIAAVAVAPAGGHVVASVTGALAAVATGGGIFGRGRAVVALALGVGLWAVSDLVWASRATSGAWLSVAGSVVTIAWFVAQARRNMATRFVSLFGTILVGMVIALASAAGFLFEGDIRNDRIDLLEQQVLAGRVDLEEELPSQLASAVAKLRDSTILPQQLIDGGADDALAADVSSVVDDPDVLLLLDADGRVVGSFDARARGPLGPAETVLAGSTLVADAREQLTPLHGLLRLEAFDDNGDVAELLAVAAEPVYGRVDGQIRRDVVAGMVVGVQRLDRRDRIDAIARRTGMNVGLLSGTDLAAATTPQDDVVDADLAALAGTSGGVTASLGGVDYFAAGIALNDPAGQRIGDLVLFEDASGIADLQRDITRLLFFVAVIGGLFATLLAAAITGRATKDIRALTAAAERIAAGDLTVRVDPRGTDEVARLALSFDDMASAVESRDVSLRVAADRESTLRERLEAVTSSMNEALLAVDGDGLVIMANPAAGDLLDVAQADLHDRQLSTLLDGHTTDGSDFVEAIGEPGSHHVISVRGQIRRGAGRRDVDATAAPLVGEQGGIGRVIVLRDVTSEAQVERMKTEFVSNAAHELRTPLTPVVGYTNLLARHEDLDPARRQMIVSELNAAALRVTDVVDKLVSFADLEAGRAIVTVEPVDVGELVDRVLETWREAMPERTFRRRVSRGLRPALLDPRWTLRIFDELMDNAVKFSEETILMTAEPSDDGAHVLLGVKDKGVGITPEAMANIREEFRQADGSATRSYGGLGLGLAIVERILQRQDGELEITSDMGQGTHVKVRLPLAP